MKKTNYFKNLLTSSGVGNPTILAQVGHTHLNSCLSLVLINLRSVSECLHFCLYLFQSLF